MKRILLNRISRNWISRDRIAGTLLAGLLLAGFAVAGPVAATREMAAEAAAPPAIPRPDLSAMEAPARAKIESMQSALVELVERKDVSQKELAEAFGHLGQLFHAYRLLDSAEEAYLVSRGLAPRDHRWAYYLGLVRHADGELTKAAADYKTTLGLKPDDRPALLRLGDVLLELDRPDEAKERYARVRELGPDNAAALWGLGKVASAAGDHAQAIELFERVLELQPEASAVHYMLGQAYRRVGDLDRAREHLQQRGEEDVDFPDPVGDQISRLALGTAYEIVLALAKSADGYSDAEFLGFALSHFGDVRGSIEQLRQGLAVKQETEVRPLEEARIHYVLGGLLVNDARDAEAVTHFRQALALAPELDDARVKLGNALARGGQLEEALAAFDEVIARRPDDTTVRLKRISALTELGRDAEARAALERLAEIDPDSSEVQVRLAMLLERSGDAAAAMARYRQAAALELSAFERPRVHYRMASLLRQRGDADQAMREYEKALEADPKFAPALEGSASLLAQRGKMREAAFLYAALVQIEPSQPGLRLAEATALILSDQHAAATTRLEEALGLFPDDIRFKDVLARHLAASPDRAVRDGERALQLALELFEKMKTPETVETLAMAYAEIGNFAEARKWQQELITNLTDEAPAALRQRLRANMAMYESDRPCCAEGG